MHCRQRPSSKKGLVFAANLGYGCGFLMSNKYGFLPVPIPVAP